MNTLRSKSIKQGLIIPEDQLFCSCGCAKAATIEEMRLISKPHRWPEMNKHMRDFFAELMLLVTKYERKMLTILNLPDINSVRIGYKKQFEPFVYSSLQEAELMQMTNEWLAELLGAASDPTTVYNNAQLRSYTIGQNRTVGAVVSVLPKDMQDIIDTTMRPPTLDDSYLQAVIRTSGERIKTELAIDNLAIIRREMEYAAANGARPERTTLTARAWHSEVCRGDDHADGTVFGQAGV